MWNDADLPLAYLITFRCYGTWLHGDKRGSIDRFHNQYKSPYLPQSNRRQELNTRKPKSESVNLDIKRRRSVSRAIRGVCDHRKWHLFAVKVRTNHAHAVVSIGRVKPERALNAFKAYSTRQMRHDRNWNESHSPWADKGSKRYLWNEQSVANAIDYVLNEQGDDLPELE